MPLSTSGPSVGQVPSRDQPLIAAEGLVFAYPGTARPALDGLSLRIEAGDYLALVGPNGSGKSSLLRLLAGLRQPDSGRVLVEGLDRADPTTSPRLATRLALVFQAPLDQIVSTNVEEDVAFGPENLGLGRTEIRARVGRALAAVGLAEEGPSPSLFLSAGQQQRLAIAGALALEPACIAFDEATAMLDPAGREAILDLMEGLRAQGTTIIHATHDMEEASRARRVVALVAGRVAYDGTPEGFFLGRDGRPAPALELGLSLPESVLAAEALGLPGRLGEGPREVASRAVASRRGGDAPAVEAGAFGADASGADADGRLPEPDRGRKPAFSLRGVGLRRTRGGGAAREALAGLDLEIPEGRLTALVGRTGAGKSSLLELLDALALPSAGRVVSLGRDTLDPAADLRSLRMGAPLAVQRPEAALFEAYAGDDVAFGPRNQGLSGPALVARVRSAMEALGLGYAEFRDRGTRGLSGGEKRRLALAGILAMESPALLLDEPTSALDPAHRAAVRGLLGRLRAEGRTVVLSTHAMEEAALCDLVVVLGEGRVLAAGGPLDLFYGDLDPAWGIRRPFVIEVARALQAEGVLSRRARPRSLPELVAALGAEVGP